MGIAIVTKLDCTYTCDRCGQTLQREHLTDKSGPCPSFPTGWTWLFASQDQNYMPWKSREVAAPWNFPERIPEQVGEIKTLCAGCSEEFSKKSLVSAGPTRQAVTELARIEELLKTNPCHHRGKEPDPDCLLCEFRQLLRIT